MTRIVEAAESGGPAMAPSGAGPAILASAATGIVGHIERLHGDIDSIFGNAGIAPEMAGLPTLQLRLAAFITLFEEAARRTGQDNFGLWFGNQFLPRDLGLWGYAAISSPTVGSALENLVEPVPLSAGLFLPALPEAQGRPAAPGIPDRRARHRGAAAGRGAVARHVPQRDPRIPAGRNGRRKRCISSIRARRPGRSMNRRSTLRSISASRPTPWCSAPTSSAARCRRAICSCSPSCRPAWSSWVRPRRRPTDCSTGSAPPSGCACPTAIRRWTRLRTICASLPAPCSASCRDHNVTYKDAVETTRRNLAEMYLQQRQLPLTEIALLLGYSELSAFSRAFTRWTGHVTAAVPAREDGALGQNASTHPKERKAW